MYYMAHKECIKMVDTDAEPLNLPAGSSCHQSKPPPPSRDHSAPLRCAVPAAPLLATALFSFMFVPLLSLLLFRYSALVPHRFSIPLGQLAL